MYDPPGGVSWMRLADHFPTPVTPAYAEVITATMPLGSQWYAGYGIPVSVLECVSLHGYLYIRPVPLIGASSTRLPPAPLLWLGARLHPRLRACAKAARRALEERPWRADVIEWTTSTRSRSIERNLEVQATRPGGLDDDELAAHLERGAALWRDGYEQHFLLHRSDLIPPALYLVFGEALGISRDDLLAPLAGWSPVSSGEDDRLTALREAIRVATDGAPLPATLDGIRALGAGVANALDAYLELHGWRMVTSYDIEGLTLAELPSLLLGRLADEHPAGIDERRRRSDAKADELRARVPLAERDTFDRLLDDARLTYGLRDDNSGILGAWPVGLVRRAYLEAAARLVATGAIAEHDHIFELRVDEVAALLRGGTAPPPAEIARRAADRAAAAAQGAPLLIGPDIVMPDASVLPDAMAWMTKAQILLAEDTGLDSPERAGVDHRKTVSGTGIGSGRARGVARVADDPADVLARLEPGEVIVTRSTNPAWNAVLPLCVALVVEEGGALSHAAIISRELALPAVIGASGATAVFEDGEVIEVDAANGIVRAVE